MIVLTHLSYILTSTYKYFYSSTLSALALLVFVLYITEKNVLLKRIRKNQRQVRLIDKFPGLGNYPFLGSVPEMLQLVLSPCQGVLHWTRQMAAKHGPIFKLWTPGQPTIFIASFEAAKKILQHENIQAKPIQALNVAKTCNAEGLLTLEPKFHGPRRKQWMQWVTRKNIEGSAKTFRYEALQLCNVLEQFAENREKFNVVDPVIHTTLRTIATSAFGEKFLQKLPFSETQQFTQDLHTFCAGMTRKMLRPWLANDWFYFNLTTEGRKTWNCIKRGNNLTQRAVSEGKLVRKSLRDSDNEPCFLDHLLDLEEKGMISEDEIIQEINVFIVTGYDTTGLSISYSLYLLSLHQEHQLKVVEELIEILGDNLSDNLEIRLEHLKEMKYLEFCIKESLRLFTISPFAHRKTTGEVVLEDGRVIPEDVNILVQLGEIHRDPKYFPDPDKFIPERHQSPIPAFMPFAQGARNCIGQMYAIQEMKMILAYLLLRYKWECVEDGELKCIWSVLLVPENGIRFKIEKRCLK